MCYIIDYKKGGESNEKTSRILSALLALTLLLFLVPNALTKGQELKLSYLGEELKTTRLF